TILLTYSLTEVINGYGFLAVFVAGVTMRQSRCSNPKDKAEQLHFTEQFEKLLEVVTILLIGSLLRLDAIASHLVDGLVISSSLLLLIRPVGAFFSLLGSPLPRQTRWLTGWFGIRGVGSLYYLTYAMGEGLNSGLAERTAWIVYIVIALSICVHGATASPLMNWYEGCFKRRLKS
ncbi:MAG: sodium:proton antiporter, partial [Leptolyngbya sp. SIO4C1]|nr:sodium:proton antiporter [Leptolyngbya sp. SIO4C1]